MALILKVKVNSIIPIAEFLATEFSNGSVTDLIAIIEDESINFYQDRYQDHFDGMLTYDSKDFHIHINTDLGNYVDSKKGRFTIGHELAHYFIDEHRLGLTTGALTPHLSFGKLKQSERIEREADYFAANLLMPRAKFRAFSAGKPFSLDILSKLSEEFQTSLLSTVLRFVEIGTHEIMVVFSKDNRVEWFSKSYDFPNLPFRFKVKGPLPPTSVAGEFYRLPNSKYTGIEEVGITDWFDLKPWAPNTQMYEQCFYSDLYGYVISIIWFK